MCSTPPRAACATSSKARRSNSAAWTTAPMPTTSPRWPAPGLRFRPRSRTRLREPLCAGRDRGAQPPAPRAAAGQRLALRRPSLQPQRALPGLPREPSGACATRRPTSSACSTFTATGPSAAPPGTATSPRRCIGHLEDDAIVFAAEDQGRRHLWQMQLPSGGGLPACAGRPGRL